jgi:glycosyltransferase involved in cell wall biosynthesis
MNKNDVWIVIAAFNEEQMIGKVVNSLYEVYNKIIVVNDGSSDRTGEYALEAKAVTLTHPINLGQGAALQTGISYALSKHAKFIVTFDADGQHCVNDIDNLLNALKNTNSEVACGSRFLGSHISMPILRKIMLKLAVLFTWTTTGIKMTDAHNGLRVFRADAAKKIKITQNRMAHASEIIEQIAINNLKMIEVPVTIVYSEYSLAKGQRMSNSINILLDLWNSRFMK